MNQNEINQIVSETIDEYLKAQIKNSVINQLGRRGMMVKVKELMKDWVIKVDPIISERLGDEPIIIEPSKPIPFKQIKKVKKKSKKKKEDWK